MKILIYGAGVVGCTYGWQLSKAGCDVTVLVRKGQKEFVQKNVNAILPKQNMSLLSLNYGSFNGTRTLCGNATIMEGLIAAYDVVSDASLKTKIAKSAAAGTSFLMKYQVQSGKMEGGIPGTSNWKSKNSQKSDKEIRIDNVQHSLSAFINYKKIMQN